MHHSNHIITYKLLLVWLIILHYLEVSSYVTFVPYTLRHKINKVASQIGEIIVSRSNFEFDERRKEKRLRKRSRRKVSVRPRLRPYIHSLTEHSARFFPLLADRNLHRLSYYIISRNTLYTFNARLIPSPLAYDEMI